MKKLLIVLLVLCFVVWLGCGDDDSTGPEEEEPTVVTAQVFSTETPSLDSANGSDWNSVPSVTVSTGSSIFSAKRAVSSPTALKAASEVDVQAAVVAEDTLLFMRLRWSDDFLHVWRDYWKINDTTEYGLPTFVRQTAEVEDQLLLMFAGLENEAWDTWHWRAFTTAITGNLDGRITGYAEGGILADTNLSADSGDLVIVMDNKMEGFSRPWKVHNTKSEFNGYILYLHEAITAENADSLGTGWDINQSVPGYLTDSTVAWPQKEEARGSQWDIVADCAYSASSSTYTLVLKRKLDTEFSDDLAMSRSSSVTMRIGVTDNLDFDFSMGNLRQAFSSEFTLSIP